MNKPFNPDVYRILKHNVYEFKKINNIL